LCKVADEGGKVVLQTGIAKFFTGDTAGELVSRMNAKPGDIIFFGAGSFTHVSKHLNWLRTTLADRRKLIPPNQWEFLWIVDMPAFEWDEEAKKWVFLHHPFTMPHDEDLPILESDPGAVRAKCYDIVLNGVELGSGSIRIHRLDTQYRIFRMLGISDAEAQRKFTHLLNALQYGAPPHGGLALGLDRIAMLLSGLSSIREVTAFPKTQKAFDPLTECPSEVDQKQLDELGIDLAPSIKAIRAKQKEK
jgi:aspartyl-tRNA synthetase